MHQINPSLFLISLLFAWTGLSNLTISRSLQIIFNGVGGWDALSEDVACV